MDELYKQKGELVTTIEIAQAKLQSVNSKIIEIMNNEKNVTKPVEV